MKVFRKVADPAIYEVVGHDGPHHLASGLLNTFPASVQQHPVSGQVTIPTHAALQWACGGGLEEPWLLAGTGG
jgi:hypothetical protein